MGVATMARPKPGKAGGRPKVDKPKGLNLNLKASPGWKAWVDELAEHCRTDVAKVVDAALVDYAKSRGFDKVAPKR